MNTNKIYFAKLKDTAIIPSKREEDGAFDIYANFEEDFMIILPNETKMIPTGLASVFSSDYVAILKERGSTGSKGMGQRAGVVDSGYRGEWFVPITNHNTNPIIISKNGEIPTGVEFEMKLTPHGKLMTYIFRPSQYIIYPYEKAITQVIMVQVPKLEISEISTYELLNFKSERGTGSLGSSNK